MKAIYRIVGVGRNVGKTSVGCRIVEALVKRGARVSVIKHCHSPLKLAAKDAEKYMEFGALASMAVAPNMIAFYDRSSRKGLAELAEEMPSFIVIAEGFREVVIGKKIVIARTAEDVEKLAIGGDVLGVVAFTEEARSKALGMGCKCFEPGEEDLLAEAILADATALAEKALPGRNCGMCGYGSCIELARAVAMGLEKLSRCPVRSRSARILVDGREVLLGPYVRMVVEKLVEALLSTLKGVPRYYKRVEVVVERED